MTQTPDPTPELSTDDLVTALKAAAEPTRLRILLLLASGELNVKDLTLILGQSQPRISRHLKLLSEAGLVERFREGSWVYFYISDRTGGRCRHDAAGGAMWTAPNARLAPRPRARRGAEARARGGPHRPISKRTCRRLGPHPRAARLRRRSRGGDAGALGAGPFKFCSSISAPARGGSSICSRIRYARGSRHRRQPGDAGLCARQADQGRPHARAGPSRRYLCPLARRSAG